MSETQQLADRFSSLPEDLKEQATDFVEFLEAKAYAKASKKDRTFGYAKSFFKMADNFGDPLDDFKEYM